MKRKYLESEIYIGQRVRSFNISSKELEKEIKQIASRNRMEKHDTINAYIKGSKMKVEQPISIEFNGCELFVNKGHDLHLTKNPFDIGKKAAKERDRKEEQKVIKTRQKYVEQTLDL